jgi:predicted transcriptional regulator
MEDNFVEQALELLQDILSMTSMFRFSGQKEKRDEEAESYIKLIEDREPLIEQLEDLQNKIEITEEIKKLIAKIVEIDKINLTQAGLMRNEMRGSIKNIKTQRKMNEAYGIEAIYENASYVDTRK